LYYSLCLGSANCQISRWEVRIYVDENPTFLKEAWQLIDDTKTVFFMVMVLSQDLSV